MKVDSEKVGLKLNIQKTKIMASGPITSWEIDGQTVETVSDFIFLGSKITTHPHALWDQQVSSPASGGPGWALTSQSPILTPLAEDGEQFRCFGWRNGAFVIPLKRPPNSLPASTL